MEFWSQLGIGVFYTPKSRDWGTLNLGISGLKTARIMEFRITGFCP